MPQPNPLPEEIPANSERSESASPEDEFSVAEKVKKKDFKTILKQPVTMAVAVLLLCVIGLVAYLEQGRIYVELPPPTVEYELLRNDGLTTGVPVAIKINQVSVFKINDPMMGGAGAERAKEIVANLEGAIADLEAEPGRIITLDLESSELPAIVQNKVDGAERRVLIQLQPEDVILAQHDDPKFVARVWAERITDALKVFMFGEEPHFTLGSEFGLALDAMYLQAQAAQQGLSLGSLNDAYDKLSDVQQMALADFPVPEPEEGLTLGEAPEQVFDLTR